MSGYRIKKHGLATAIAFMALAGGVVTYTGIGPDGPATNRDPNVNAGADDVAVVDVAYNLNGSCTDDDFGGTTLVCTWTKVSGSGTCVFGDDNDPTTTVTCDAIDAYVLQLEGDDTVADPVTDTVALNVQDVNVAPTMAALDDESGDVDEAIAIVCSCTDDSLPDPPNAITYAWTQTAGSGACAFGDATDPTTTVECDEQDEYTIQCVCSDSLLTDSDTLALTVGEAEVDDPPVANAGSDGSGTVGIAFNIDGSCTDDGSVTAEWSKTSGNGSCTFGDASDPTTTATCTGDGSIVLQLECDDGVNAPDTDTASFSLVYLVADAIVADGYTIRGAYSLSDQVRAAHTGAIIRLIRTDTSESDITPTAGVITDEDLEAGFCSATDCFLLTAYDQDGSAQNLTASSSTRRPMVCDDGVCFTCGPSGVLCADWDGDTSSGGANGDRMVNNSSALGFSGNPAISVAGNGILDGSITTDRFPYCIGAATPGNAFCRMSFGASNLPNVSYIGERVGYPSADGDHVAQTTWQWNLLTHPASGRNDATKYYTNGNELSPVFDFSPAGTDDDLMVMTDSRVSWGDGLDNSLGLYPGRMNTIFFVAGEITNGGAAELALTSFFSVH